MALKLPHRREPGFALFVAANSLAAWPPYEREPGEEVVLVPWSFIEQLRAGLEEAGLDWRGAKQMSDTARSRTP